MESDRWVMTATKKLVAKECRQAVRKDATAKLEGLLSKHRGDKILGAP